MDKRRTRDNTIDFFRGIAAICIIFIHTCFWSGTSYTPVKMQALSLIIDVPIFVFISGMSFNFSNSLFKTIKGFCKLWYKYIVFLIIYYILIFLFDNNNFSLENIIGSIFFKFNGNDIFPVVSSSLWFIFMFFIVSILCDIIICEYNKNFKDKINFKYIIIIFFMFYGISLYKANFTFITVNIFMYSFIYLLGYYSYNIKIKRNSSFVIQLMTLLFILFVFQKYMALDIEKMQIYKFSYDIKYLLYSSISMLIVFFLKDRIKIKSNNLFTYIGKNALTFYFAQGISSSILYFILPKISINLWFIKLLVMFIINIIITTILSFCIKFLYEIILKIFYRKY